ncbi:MAG: hypothetical protein MK188_11460 [Gammaproteobacteria bacterium]|nr:hypothetical protein [Gammaproteobacteria bacterium]
MDNIQPWETPECFATVDTYNQVMREYRFPRGATMSDIRPLALQWTYK